jgi:glycine cleavage system transcriptional repressor
MPNTAPNSTALISIFCADYEGLIADVTGRLYELGANLGDTSFAVLGSGAKFTLVTRLPAHVSLAEIERELAALPALKEADLKVEPFRYRDRHGEKASITHRVEIVGEDSPGLIARLAEAFRQYGVNIVRLSSEAIPTPASPAPGTTFVLRMALYVPPAKVAAAMATMANTAGQMNLRCTWQQVG